MYYEEGLSQDLIANAMGVSRSNVSRMLADAKAQGIVQIRIVEQTMRDTPLEDRLRTLLKVRTVRVSRSLSVSDELTAVGALAAEALTKRLRSNSQVAVSWGSTLQAMVDAMNSEYLPGVSLYPMVGGMTPVSAGASGDALIRNLADKLNAEHMTLLAPAVVSSAVTRNAIISEPSIAEVLDHAAAADIGVVGIGSKRGSSTMELLKAAGLPDSVYDKVMADMAGDLAARFYDIDGRPVGHGWDDRIIGLSLEQVRRIPHVIGVAAGASKALGVIGAARGGYVSELVLSSSCALAMLRYLDSELEEEAS